ncbi:unnamed protein product [Clonostachys byssicola]|uniref:Uncharacterized protein n=1 Tax=Clonostachys byssicola TaxID=160290 RepID=A0A9N9XXD6_9HYPO|nr:unnamed protein product [Clonostachys byssicola]
MTPSGWPRAQKNNAPKAKTQKGNASKGKAANGKTTPAKAVQKAKTPEGKKAALAKGNKSTNSPKGAEASCSEKRGLGSVGAACKTKFGKASNRKGKNTKDAQDPNVRKDAGTQKLEELAKKKGIELEHDATYVIKEKTGGKTIPHEYVAGVKYQKTNNQGVEEHTATGKRYDLFVGGKKVNVKDRIQKNQDQVDATVNAKGSSKIPVVHSKHNAYIEEHTWYPNKKKGGRKLLGKMDSKFVGPDGPEGWEILKEGGKILTGDPYEQAGGKYSILAHCTKGGDANNCKTMAKKLGDTIVEKPREVSY